MTKLVIEPSDSIRHINGKIPTIMRFLKLKRLLFIFNRSISITLAPIQNPTIKSAANLI
jgi:hypothetical protein